MELIIQYLVGTIMMIVVFFLILGLIKPDLPVFDKLPYYEGKKRSTKRWYLVGYYFFSFWLMGLITLPFYKDIEGTKTSVEQQATKSDNTELEQDSTAFAWAENLYEELIEFKDTENFKTYGLGVGGKYNGWLKRVQEFPEDYADRVLKVYGLAIGEIEQLALHYAEEKPNASSEYKKEGDKMKARLDRIFIIHQRLDADFSDETEKAFSSKNKEVIGKWKLDSKKKEYSTFTLDIIYVDDNYYYCKTYANKSETERGKLIEALDRLYDATSIAGEYFEVSGKNLTTGDDYGTYLDYNITPLE